MYAPARLMPIEHVTRAVAIDNLAVFVSAYRYVCDHCGNRETFADVPMPEGNSEFDAQRRGWRILWENDGEGAQCPACSARRDAKARASQEPQTKEEE
jgi:hypothetical protein